MASPLESVRLDVKGWSPIQVREGALAWKTPEGDGVALFHMELAPDIGADLSDVDGLRRSYRHVYERGLGIIEIDLVAVAGCSAVRTIFKTPQRPHGMTYLGSLTLPFRDFSYVIKVQCAEMGLTGARDSAVLKEFIEMGLLKLPPAAERPVRLHGWMRDPYDDTFEAPLMWNPSEAAEYDERFPGHPLSRIRRLLRHLETTTEVAPEVRTAAPFVYRRGGASMPRWQFWRRR